MTNVDSVLKSRDITLPTKVRLVKAMVFPVVMYEWESWTLKKFIKTTFLIELLNVQFYNCQTNKNKDFPFFF